MSCRRKPGDAMGQRFDEITKFSSRQRSIDPTVSFGKIRVVVLGAQHDFERAPATHQSRQMLRSAGPRNNTERRLELTKDRRLSGSEAHVAGQDEFATHAADTAFDLRD